MRSLVLALLLAGSAVATDYVTLYREQGIESVRQELDRALTTPAFWESYLQDKDLSFGYFENLTTLLHCDKNSSKLYLYYRAKDGKTKLFDTFSALTGKVEGDKYLEGDHKTPIGIYNLTKKINHVDPFYGPMAYVTSYPNLYDKIRGKNGSGIWIHGQPLDGERERFTKGCIALDNNDLICLDENVSIEQTLLIISEGESKKSNREKLSRILSDLFKWKTTWTDNDLDGYMAFYSERFRRFDGKDYSQFLNYKKRIFSYEDHKTIRFDNINVLPYPNAEEELYWVQFDETYRSDRLTFVGKKDLIVMLTPENGMKIIAEK